MTRYDPDITKKRLPKNKLITCTLTDGRSKVLTIERFLNNQYILFQLNSKNGQDPDPIQAMNTFKLFVEAEEPVPEELRNWFVSRVNKFMIHKGEHTLGSVFGFKGRENEKSVFTKQSKGRTKDLVREVFNLISITGFSKISSARLVLWRANIGEDELLPETLATQYGRNRKSGKYRFEEPPNPDLNYIDLYKPFLKSYLIDRKIRHDDIRKSLKKIRILLLDMENLTPNEHYEFIAGLYSPPRLKLE